MKPLFNGILVLDSDSYKTLDYYCCRAVRTSQEERRPVISARAFSRVLMIVGTPSPANGYITVFDEDDDDHPTTCPDYLTPVAASGL